MPPLSSCEPTVLKITDMIEPFVDQCREAAPSPFLGDIAKPGSLHRERVSLAYINVDGRFD